MTAIAFAVVGSFEDAVDNWRQCAAGFAITQPDGVDRNEAIVLAATAGAVNVKLGGSPLRTAQPDVADTARPQSALPVGAAGRMPEPAHLRSVVGLVWRSVVLWMVLLALLTLARLLG